MLQEQTLLRIDELRLARRNAEELRIELVDTADTRKFLVRGGSWKLMALTSLSWILPVELTPDGLSVVAVHYDRAIAPQGSYQCYGVEDARVLLVRRRVEADDRAALEHLLGDEIFE